jgi:hypothetical protein
MPYLLYYAQSAPNEMSIKGGMEEQIEINDSIPQFPLAAQHLALSQIPI